MLERKFDVVFRCLKNGVIMWLNLGISCEFFYYFVFGNVVNVFMKNRFVVIINILCSVLNIILRILLVFESFVFLISWVIM